MSLLTQPSELKHNQPISCLIYGQPGTGKTTLALSADKPVLIDLDRGLYRVEKRFQCPSLQVENYQQILDLINSDELRPFNTIVIDTLGKLVDRMGDFVARQNPKFKQGDGTLSMKAWGAIKIQFAALVKQIFNSNKSVTRYGRLAPKLCLTLLILSIIGCRLIPSIPPIFRISCR